MRKIPAKWPSAAPLMKSPKTRYRQAFRGLPFRKWDVGNRKCAGFLIRGKKGIRSGAVLRFASATRHSRGQWARRAAPTSPFRFATLRGPYSSPSLPAHSDVHRTSSGCPDAA